MNQLALPPLAARKRVLLVDDDADLLSIRKLRLLAEGYSVHAVDSSAVAMNAIDMFQPDIIVLDLIMPGISGETLLAQLRENERFRAIKIVVNTAKSFECDQRHCLESGADAYLAKPADHDALANLIRKLLRDEVTVTFWGTRGSIPRPGKDTLKFGGNTPCVSVELSDDRLFLFDAGTGLVDLGRTLVTAQKQYKFNLFVSHPHWDHIQGLPFFQPLYLQGNEMVIHGTSHGRLSLREVISGQMDSLYFPVTIKEYASRVYFKELEEGDYEIEKLPLSTISLNHPGRTLGYRLGNGNGKSVAYITDNEIFPEGDEHNRRRLAAFLSGVDVLIHDATYFDEEYPARARWGHSALSEVLKLADEARVKRLYLFHHDPAHDDEAVEKKELFGKRFFEKRNSDIQCSAAREGVSVRL
ncbi:MAG: response regulator [Betaproteobacteria bacterium]|nr:response regulator [Betaproteobacteria bacterium]